MIHINTFCSRITGRAVLAGIALLLLCLPAAAFADLSDQQSKFCSPEWYVRPTHAAGLGRSAGENPAVALNIPPSSEVVCEVEDSAWQGWRRLTVALEVPEDFPRRAFIYFFTKDWDHLWRQVRMPVVPGPEGRVEFNLPLYGPQATAIWRPKGHKRTWHVLTPGQVRRFGFRLSDNDEKTLNWAGKIRIASMRLTGRIDSSAPLHVRDVRLNTSTPVVGRLCEARLKIEGYFENPFDRAGFKVQGVVECPDGTQKYLTGFYYEGFVTEPDGAKKRLVPYGAPEFRIRFTPRVVGKYVLRTQLVGGDGAVIALSPLEFHVQAPAQKFRGVVQVDSENPLLMEYETGQEFRGIGLNLRTPTDTRYLKMAPFSGWKDEGLQIYRKMFPKLAAAGVNTVEVWMSSWWLALEWINDAPGFHGVGYYNQYRAWLLDRLVELAEENGIYLIFVLNNHGKFSSFCDAEWDRNPYNRENGGWLAQPDDYFEDRRARDAFKRTADYIVSRWGYSPNILCWKLFSEINLTGTSAQDYKKPSMRNWHREMAGYLKEIDSDNHMVTTHWSTNYRLINDSIAGLDDLDFLTTDAYDKSTRRIVELFRQTSAYGKRKSKPALITEFGGSSMGDTLGTLIKQFHLSLWEGYFNCHAISPMFWWFEIVEEQDLYSQFAAFAAFSKGVDRREMNMNSYQLQQQHVTLKILSDDQNVLAWGYDNSYFYSRDENADAPEIKDVSMNIAGLAPGAYNVQIWDCKAARPVKTRPLKIYRRGKEIEVQIPPFRRDFALKVTPK